MATVSYLLTIPHEILENIALKVVQCNPLGPIAAIIPLLCTCKHIYERISLHRSQHLYAGIYRSRFDTSSLERRSDDNCVALRPSQLAKLLVLTSIALKGVKRCDIDHPQVVEILWAAFILMMENDGKNRCQLESAGLDVFLDRFIRERMGVENPTQWPSDNAANSLALWLMWMTTTREKLMAETDERRQEIINIVYPYVVLTFRYPTAHAPPNYFTFPLSQEFNREFPVSATTLHGDYPVHRDPQSIICQPALSRSLKISPPLIITAARLIYFSRREVKPFAIPPHLPETREHALQLGRPTGPTQADIIEFNSHLDTRLVPATPWDSWGGRTEDQLDDEFREPSEHWDNDWRRMIHCMNPFKYRDFYGSMYRPGLLNGLWQGRMLVPGEAAYIHLLETPERPADFSENRPNITTVPLFMRLREHHSISPRRPASTFGSQNFDHGLRRAYLPTLNLQESGNKVLVHEDERTSIYESYVPGNSNSHNPDTCETCLGPSPALPDFVEADFASVGLGRNSPDEDAETEYDSSSDDMEVDSEEDEIVPEGACTPKNIVCNGIQDVIFTGATDLRHAQAWNGFTFAGRVRSWDGLIAIIRIPLDQRLGRVIFYGYLVGEQNFVGTWRAAGEDVGLPTWECSFSMSRRAD